MGVELTFPLVSEPTVPDPAPTGTSVGPTATAPFDDRAGLGYGLLAPFRRDNRSDFATGGGLELIRSNILRILGVRADDGKMTGEIPWRQSFGSLISKLRYMHFDDSFNDIARHYVGEALERWEPRVRVRSVEAQRTFTNNQPNDYIRIAYDVVVPGGDTVSARQRVDVPLSA